MEISQITTIIFAAAYFLESLSNFLLKKENKKLQLRIKELQLIRESEIKHES